VRFQHLPGAESRVKHDHAFTDLENYAIARHCAGGSAATSHWFMAKYEMPLMPILPLLQDCAAAHSLQS
jgi:hypothetical protein